MRGETEKNEENRRGGETGKGKRKEERKEKRQKGKQRAGRKQEEQSERRPGTGRRRGKRREKEDSHAFEMNDIPTGAMMRLFSLSRVFSRVGKKRGRTVMSMKKKESKK